MVSPGNYQVRLTVGNKTMTQNFKILLDPRMKAEGITSEIIQKQSAMQDKVMSLLSEARRLQDQLETEVKSLQKDESRKAKKRMSTINKVLKELKNEKRAYPQQMLVSQISYLYNMVNGPDQVIGKDVLDRYDELSAKFKGIKASLL